MRKTMHLLYWIFKARGSGLKKTPYDARDFKTGIFGWFEYKPKHQEHIIKTLSIKNQNPLNICFPGTALVLMEDMSYKKISDIRAGEYVFSHFGNKKMVSKTMKRKWQGKMHILKLGGDFREIVSTREHPILCLENSGERTKNKNIIENGKIEFLEAGKITSNDWLALPFNNYVKDLTLYEHENDPDFLWVLGLYLAEGSLNSHQVVFSLNIKELEFFHKIKKTIGKYGGSVTHSTREEFSRLTVTINNKRWVNIFRNLGGEYSDKKNINKRLLFLEPSLQMNIYNGLKDGDSYDHRDGYNIIHITSYKLLEQIRTILLRNGKYSLFRKHTEVEGKKQSWSLSYSNKSKTYHVKDNYCLVKVRSSNKSSFPYSGGHVYNIEVEDDNSYQVNGIAVHNCQWATTTVQKEIDEKIELDEQSLVIKGKMMGLVSGNGYSNLRNGQKVLQKWGILPMGYIKRNMNNWSDYSDPRHIKDLDSLAAKHKISSYWSVSSRGDALKLLDDNRVISTGLRWYSGFNMGGGFSFPWLISFIIGLLVGGHAIAIIGYILNYHGKKVYVCQNSYGKRWGDNGKFYIDMDFLDKVNYGYFTNLDEINKELGELLMNYDGKNVKGKGHPAIYHIQKGVKKPYTSWLAYLSYNGLVRGYTEVDKNVLDQVKEGDIMDVKKSYYWDFLKQAKKDNQLDLLLTILNKEE